MEAKDKKVYPIQPAGKGPRRAKIPYHRARRWIAEGENGRSPGLQIFVTQHAYTRICAHAASDMDNEVGGWLAGRWCRDYETKTEFVVVEALLPAQQVRSGSTFLTFTHDSQVAMLAALEERYAKKGVVGWYHTHPRMGVFLSGYDVWLHEHFFPQPWQVALVVEPHSEVGGFFIRNKDNKLDPRRYYGFYELQNRRVESVVNWQNLHLDKKEEAKKEEAIAEKKAAQQKVELAAAAAKPQRGPSRVEVKPPKPKKVSVRANSNNKIDAKPADVAAKPTPVEPKVEVKTNEEKALDIKRPELKINVQKKEVEIKPEPKPEIKNSEEAKS